MSGSAFAVTHHAFSSGAGRTSDGNGSHASTLKSPSYTKSVSWQHYQNAGIVVDTVKSKVRLFNEYNDKIYSFEQISNINYFTIEIPEINTSPILMFISSKFNVGKKPLTSLHYVLRITVNNDEIKKFEIKLPKDNEIIPSICICEYWISVFEKYVIQLDHKAAK